MTVAAFLYIYYYYLVTFIKLNIISSTLWLLHKPTLICASMFVLTLTAVQ